MPGGFVPDKGMQPTGFLDSTHMNSAAEQSGFQGFSGGDPPASKCDGTMLDPNNMDSMFADKFPPEMASLPGVGDKITEAQGKIKDSMDFCKKKEEENYFDGMQKKLEGGDFQGLMQSFQGDPAAAFQGAMAGAAKDHCKKMLGQSKDGCDHMKETMCQFLQPDFEFSMDAMQHMMKTQMQAQVADQGCSAVQTAMEDPKKAGPALVGGAKSAATGAVLTGMMDGGGLPGAGGGGFPQFGSLPGFG
jgi:hypothetical protein